MTEITKTALKRIIKEEAARHLAEQWTEDPGRAEGVARAAALKQVRAARAVKARADRAGEKARDAVLDAVEPAMRKAADKKEATARAQIAAAEKVLQKVIADYEKQKAAEETGAGWAEKVMSPGKTAGEALAGLKKGVKKGGKAAMDWYKKQGGKPPSATPPAATPAKPGKLSKAGRKGLRATIRMLRTTLKALPREKKEERKKIRNQIRQIRKQLGAGRRGRPGNKYFDRGCKVLASRYGKNKDCTGMYHKFYEEVEGVQVGGPIARALGLKDYKWGSKHTKALKMLKGQSKQPDSKKKPTETRTLQSDYERERRAAGVTPEQRAKWIAQGGGVSSQDKDRIKRGRKPRNPKIKGRYVGKNWIPNDPALAALKL